MKICLNSASIFTVKNSEILSDSQHINLFVMSPSNIYNYLDMSNLIDMVEFINE